MYVTHLAVEQIIQAFLAILFAFFSIFITLILFFYFSRKKIVKVEVEKKNLEVEYQKSILQSIIATQEEERKRIAQDLHDDISSKLNIVSLNTHLLRTPNLSDSEITEITQNIIDLTKKALENSRRIAHDLLPPVLEKFGLHAGIEELVFECNTSKSVKVSYSNKLKNLSLSDVNIDNQLHIFRIIQELINNSIKHGESKEISIFFAEENANFIMEYSDNGRGIDLNKIGFKKGIGLSNIESRVTIINGKYNIISSPNKGMKFKLSFSHEYYD